jgi:tetratricopeptide (TPR) repeat protein
MDDPLEMYLKGMVLQKEKRHREAILAFELSLEIDPDNTGAWNGKGLSHANIGESEDSIRSLDRSLALDAKNPTTWYTSGLALNHLGREKEALTAFKEVLLIDPESALSWYGQGLVLTNDGNLEEASVAFGKSQELSPGFLEPLVGIARIRFLSGEYQKAKEAYDIVLQAEPDNL